jgi:trehalose/maltose hydrolase-like predicted phosphorylase
MNTRTLDLDTGPSTWHVVEDRFVPSLAAGRESIFTVGNGYLSTRGSFEERTTGEVRATFIQGLFVTPPGELPLLGAVPDWTAVAMTFDGHPFGTDGSLGGYRRSLDMRRGILEREVLWRASESGVVKIRFRRLVSMAQPHLAALEVTLTALTNPVELWLETGIDTAVPSPSFPVWNPLRWARPDKAGLRLEAASIDDAHRLFVETRLGGPGRLELIRDPHHHRFTSQTILGVGRPVTFTKFTTYHSNRDIGQPDPPPGGDVSFDTVATASARAWAKRWQAARIDIEGDPISERGVRFAAFQVIGASPTDDTGAAVGAKLASGFGYRHHVFWDTDIFIVPYLTVTLPGLARNHLGYRFRGLDGARRKAKRYGREGAFYAWESAATGDEVTPEWTSPDFGPPSRIWTGEIEEHITSDVAFAAHNYWRWTGDDKFLRDEGMEMIVEGARYWASRLQVEANGAHIRGVIGPDEYHSHVDDSFYTNLLAGWHLDTASDLVDHLASSSPRVAAALAARLGIGPTEPETWRRLADQVTLLDRADGVWEQHAGFFGLEPVDLSLFTPRRKSMYDLLGMERAERSQVIKQADVVMAMTLLPEAVGSRSRRKRNWDYYVERCDQGSSLSMAVHARVAADLGLGQVAYDMFRAAIAIDLDDVMGNARDGLHAATQGGILQAAIFGFAGLHLQDDEPELHPHLPEAWTRLGFSFCHRGTRFERELAGTQARRRKASSSKTTNDKEERHETQ